MKKCILTLLTITINFTCHAKNNIKFFTKQPLSAQQVPQLSNEQLSELNYLDQKLNEFGDITKQEWTHNESVRILIERTELAIQQSSPTTQQIMKQQIMAILKDHGVNIDFTSQNIIHRTDTNYLDSLESFVEDFINEDKKEPTKKHRHATRPAIQKESKELLPQKSISGKRRTLNKIKRDALEEAKNTAAQEAKERALDALAKQKTLNEATRRKELIDAAADKVKQQYKAEQEEQKAREAAQKRSFIASPENDAVHDL